MEITCWNCKTKTTIDRAAVEEAVKKMDETKLGFFDVPCPSCSKANRTKREEFEKALAEPVLTAREATQQTKEENAKRRGDDKEKGAGKKALEKIKKGRK
jgi:hypothetical protein